MAAETNASEQDSQIQEETISSQTEDLKKKVAEIEDDERPALNGNHAENNGNGAVEPSTGVDDDERPMIEEEESNEADAGIPDELPSSESNEAAVHNEADSGTAPEEDVNNGSNEADSGIDEQPTESIEADSGTTIDEATASTEVDTTQVDEGSAVESVSSTATDVTSKTEETKTNGVKEKEEKTEKKDTSLGSTVAKHYNEISPITRESRKESRIFHLRNFNNWVKSVVISEYLEKVKRRKRLSDDVNVLDIACGKGGDILKWQKGKIDHVIMADIAAKSIDECKERYNKLQKDQRNSRYHRDRLFSAEFFVADCTKKRLNDLYKNKGVKLDIASCQFAFHYSFESYEQADLMLKNCCENLRVGGYFIGTTPDAQKLVKHIKACKADSFGNSVFNIKPDDKECFPLFGSKYMFYLEGVVDCPEFIVYLPLLEKMAAKYNMKLVWKKNFHDLFKEYHQQYSSLINRMNALESYPSSSGQQAGGSESQYKSAKDYVDKKGNRKVGTLSADEWEVAGLYIAFAFEKMEPPRDKKRDDKRDDRRDDRKRTRDDRGSTDQGRTDDRHRKTSDSSNTKRSRRDVEEEYEIKDEVYDDDDKPEDRSRSERSSKSSRSSSSNRRSHRDERSESSRSRKRDSSSSRKDKSDSSTSASKEERKGEKAEVVEECATVESSQEVAETDKSEDAEQAPAVSSSEPQDADMVESSDAVVEKSEEVESTTVEGEDNEVSTAVDEEEVESTTVTSAGDEAEPSAAVEEDDNGEEDAEEEEEAEEDIEEAMED